MPEAEDIWLQAGYQRFAELGPEGLKVEPLAKKAGISKSSFYHHFADTQGFVEALCNLHLRQCRLIADKERNCKTINPDLIAVLISHKTDLFLTGNYGCCGKIRCLKPPCKRQMPLPQNTL